MGKFFNFFYRLQLNLTRFERMVRLNWLKQVYNKRFLYGRSFQCSASCRFNLDQSSAEIHFGQDVQIRENCFFRAERSGVLVVGNHVFFNNGCSVNCMHSIRVGNHCQMGENVKFYDHNHIHGNKDLRINEQGYTTGAIILGDNCWIGSNVVILKGVHIGDNVVIGAGCIVYKSIPSNSVVINHQNLVIQ